jgi:hypothetical protein
MSAVLVWLIHANVVMAALVAATHDLFAAWAFMGGRDKPGHDGLIGFQTGASPNESPAV